MLVYVSVVIIVLLVIVVLVVIIVIIVLIVIIFFIFSGVILALEPLLKPFLYLSLNAPGAIATCLCVFAAAPECLALIAASLGIAFYHRCTTLRTSWSPLFHTLLPLGFNALFCHVFCESSCLLECR